MNHPLAFGAGLLLCVLLARLSKLSSRDLEYLHRVEQWLATRAVLFVLGFVNALLVWWWMGWDPDPPPIIHDEAAYLLQAALFARGQWTGEAPPLQEFFAQMHVLTEPVLASKYPPGFSLLLTPFVAIGFPALGPMAFAAISGVLVFILARRIGGSWLGLLTWLVWTSASAVLRYQASFLSQTVSLPLWLGVMYLLLEYRARPQQWALVSIGSCLGMLAITRPVTAAALAVPVSVIVTPTVWRTRAWRSVTLALFAGAVFVTILPIQNRSTTGDWRLSPLVAYSTKYTPFDFPGFDYSAMRAPARLPPDLEMVRDFLTEARRQHTLPNLPTTLWMRMRYITRDLFGGWRAPLLLTALIGAFTLPSAGAIALVMSAGLLLAHIVHAHWPQWTVYYFEGYPAILFASAVGLAALSNWVGRGRITWERVETRTLASSQLRAAVGAMCAVMALWSSVILPKRRAIWQRETAYQQDFKAALAAVERDGAPAIVFVDYGRTHDVHASLIWNVPDRRAARTWIAYHRGIDNLRLMRLAPERQAFVFRADEGRLVKLPPIAEIERAITIREK